MKKKIILLLLAILVLSGCETDSPYSGYAVYFTCDTGYYPFNHATSLGQFITVRRKQGGTPSYEVTDAVGNKHIHQLTEMEARQQFQYGLGGLIIGTPSLEGGTLWAFDLACPNCDSQRHRLELDDIGRAQCPNCNALFDLNSGGIPIEGKSRVMWRYRVFTAGTMVTIQN
ncbi:MAG: hypothetical protein IKD40_02185 [Bacteroidaceae bacterium]|nr:hypothetical protein [Bacteroidaceae bacterium]